MMPPAPIRMVDVACRCGCDAWHAVMLRHPIAVKTKAFGMNSKGSRIGQRLTDAAAFNDGDEVQNGKTDHRLHMGR
jgi:hypothetical protein